MPQFAQSLRLDLSNSLSGDIKLLAHLIQSMVGVHVDAEAHTKHLGFPRGEATQHLFGGFTQAFVDRRIDGLIDGTIFDKIT